MTLTRRKSRSTDSPMTGTGNTGGVRERHAGPRPDAATRAPTELTQDARLHTMTRSPLRYATLPLFLLLAACAATPAPAPSTVTAPAPAATAGPAPGQWQLVLEVEDMPGAGKVPAQTMTLCSTPEDKKQWADMVGGKSAAGCTVRDYRAAGATISYVMQCGGGIEGRTLITVVDDDNYRGESSLSLTAGDRPATIRSKVTAKRLSPTCKK